MLLGGNRQTCLSSLTKHLVGQLMSSILQEMVDIATATPGQQIADDDDGRWTMDGKYGVLRFLQLC
jgi:hypothetical protein